MVQSRAPRPVGLPASLVTGARVGFDALTAYDDRLYWAESRPEHDGRHGLTSWGPDGRRMLTSPSLDVGNDVHAYGGGSYAVAPDGVWCVSGVDGQLHRLERGRVRRLTAADPVVKASYADLAAVGGEVLAVRETPLGERAGDELVAVTASGVVRSLTRTEGFLAAPRPSGDRLAWLSWSTDRMPWDGSELWVAAYRGGELGPTLRVAGGADESVTQPVWGPDGWLYFVSDRTGWWNLYRWRAGTRGGMVEPVAPMDAELDPGPWELGYASYVFLDEGRVAMAVQEGPRYRLVVRDRWGEVLDVPLPYTSIKPYLAAHAGRVALIGSSPTATPEVALVDISSQPSAQSSAGSSSVQVLAHGPKIEVDPAMISQPVLFTVADGHGPRIGAVLYPPSGAGERWRAPLIVRPHAGPTYGSDLRLDWEVQFFTSRGFAVVDVDYRGSTGYGRAFRQALDDRWGIDDVTDCRRIADHLLAQGRITPGQVFISGASAGGYTALRAVSIDGPFSAAVARSAIIDARRWTTTAPRFQRAHAATLAHGEAVVRPAAVRRPVLLIHGTHDAVAPISEAIALVASLRARGATARLVTLDEVGHEMSVPDHTETALNAELDLYQTILTGNRT